MNTVIIGSGVAGVGLALELKKLNPTSEVVIVTHEGGGHYSRPLLSHGFSKADIESRIILKSFDEIRALGIEVLEKTEVLNINREMKELKILTNGIQSDISYDQLVIATGSAAAIPPPLAKYQEHFQNLNSFDDLKKLRKKREEIINSGKSPKWLIIGGGLIGCEVASDLQLAGTQAGGDQITIYHAMDRLMERQLTPEQSQKLHTHFSSLGIEIHYQTEISGIEKDETSGKIRVSEKKSPEGIDYDGVLIATGFKPRTGIALAAGLECNRGIKVNEFLTTSDPNIFSLGDVTEVGEGSLFPFILPIRNQVVWLAQYLTQKLTTPWTAPAYAPKVKIHGFKPD